MKKPHGEVPRQALLFDPSHNEIEHPEGGLEGFFIQPHGNLRTVAKTKEEFSHLTGYLFANSPLLYWFIHDHIVAGNPHNLPDNVVQEAAALLKRITDPE